MRFFVKRAAMAIGLFMAGAVGAGWVTPARADDPSYLTIGAGSWETMRDKDRTAELDIAYRSDAKFWIFKPQVGLVVAKDGDYVGYAGVLVDIYWGPRLVTTLSEALSVWGGGGFNLGSRVEFRSGGEIGWRFDDKSRIAVGFYHISNAGLTLRNPGDESAMMTYSYPLGNLFSSSDSKGAPMAQTNFSRPN